MNQKQLAELFDTSNLWSSTSGFRGFGRPWKSN